jgi:hypothetical protein
MSNPFVDSQEAIVWQEETAYGPLIRRKEVRERPAYRDSFTSYWLEAPLAGELFYECQGRDHALREIGLGPFLCSDPLPAHRHVRVEPSFCYNIVAVCGEMRVRMYEPWLHFEQIVARCQEVLAYMRLPKNATTQRARCVHAMVLALVDERGLFPDSFQMLHLYQRVLEGPQMQRTAGGVL